MCNVFLNWVITSCVQLVQLTWVDLSLMQGGTRGVVGVPGPVSRQVRGRERVQRRGATNATVIAGGIPRPCHRKPMLVCIRQPENTEEIKRGRKDGEE